MRRNLVWLSVLCVCVCSSPTVFAQGLEFREFTSKAGRYKVQMPGSPKFSTQDVIGIAMRVFAYESSKGSYTTAYGDTPIPANESDVKTQNRLDGGRDGALKAVNAKLLDEKYIFVQNKHPGREVTAELPNKQGYLRAQIIIVNTRMYALIVIGNKTWVDSKDSRKFLDSFVITQ